MSFFVSESLKGIITEKDLEADSPIKIVEEKVSLHVQITNIPSYPDHSFEIRLAEVNFGKKVDSIIVETDSKGLSNIFLCNNKNLKYSILSHKNQCTQDTGIFVLNKLEVNNKDNYVTCKIDIFKRS